MGKCGVSSAYGQALAEAAGVCLDDQEHPNPVSLALQGDATSSRDVIWPSIDDQMRRTWNDDEVATEYGAMAVALLLAVKVLGYRIIERMKKGRGFDYVLAPETADANDRSQRAWLEVSGIRKGGDSTIRTRLRQKLKQTSKQTTSGRAYIIIVEFGRPIAQISA